MGRKTRPLKTCSFFIDPMLLQMPRNFGRISFQHRLENSRLAVVFLKGDSLYIDSISLSFHSLDMNNYSV
jgi:hypothetical protein